MRDVHQRISELREKKTRTIVGLMSGTSADGITAAVTKITGTGINADVELLGYKTYPYEAGIRERVFSLFLSGEGSVQDVCMMNNVLGEAFAEAANKIIDETDSIDTVDFIGSHGQTIWHQPHGEPLSEYRTESTLQIAEPAVISEKTGLPVVADFRKADMAVGGEGAPLTPYLDFVLHRDSEENRVLQNIGGIANLTFLPVDAELKNVVAYDTGPGNMIIDALVKRNTGANHDADGALARKGTVNKALLYELLAHPYYKLKPPKTTGREVFGEQYSGKIAERATELNVPFEDLIATVTQLTVETILEAYETLPKIDAVYVSGGGSKNPAIMDGLHEGLEIPVYDYSVLGLPSEAKEAVLMALLANEHIMGTPCNMVAATGASRQVILGYITWI